MNEPNLRPFDANVVADTLRTKVWVSAGLIALTLLSTWFVGGMITVPGWMLGAIGVGAAWGVCYSIDVVI